MKPAQGISQKEKQLEAKLKEIEQKRLKEVGIIKPLKEPLAPKTFPQKTAKEEFGDSEIEGKIARFEKEIKNLADLKTEASKIPTTELLEVLFAGAISTRASDIHFEPEEKEIRLRFRIDGFLQDVFNLKKEDYPAILNRIKLMAGLKINIREAPQDGRFTISGEPDIEVRVSVLPGAYQENIVLRLLDPRIIKKNLEELGLRQNLLEEVKKQLKKTTGSILTTGPTGSGKTTTLYAFIDFVNEPGVKIITIEDPVEYHVKGISQTQVEPSKGYDFSSGLRSIVRQDPDVIMVGEIRDEETAEIAMHAALTGHLVFSTLHTNDAAGTIPRLIDMKVKPQVIAPAVSLAIAQRLVRRLCPECKEKDRATNAEIGKIKEVLKNLPEPNRTNWMISKAKGCQECNNTGYKGRIGVFEGFAIDEDLEKLILKSPAISEIRALVIKKGMITLKQDAFLKIIEGITDLEEAERVLGG